MLVNQQRIGIFIYSILLNELIIFVRISAAFENHFLHELKYNEATLCVIKSNQKKFNKPAEIDQNRTLRCPPGSTVHILGAIYGQTFTSDAPCTNQINQSPPNHFNHDSPLVDRPINPISGHQDPKQRLACAPRQIRSGLRNLCNGLNTCDIHSQLYRMQNATECIYPMFVKVNYTCVPVYSRREFVCADSYVEVSCEIFEAEMSLLIQEAELMYGEPSSSKMVSSNGTRAACPYQSYDSTCQNTDASLLMAQLCNHQSKCTMNPNQLVEKLRNSKESPMVLGLPTCPKPHLFLKYTCVHPLLLRLPPDKTIARRSDLGAPLVKKIAKPKRRNKHLVGTMVSSPKSEEPILAPSKMELNSRDKQRETNQPHTLLATLTPSGSVSESISIQLLLSALIPASICLIILILFVIFMYRQKKYIVRNNNKTPGNTDVANQWIQGSPKPVVQCPSISKSTVFYSNHLDKERQGDGNLNQESQLEFYKGNLNIGHQRSNSSLSTSCSCTHIHCVSKCKELTSQQHRQCHFQTQKTELASPVCYKYQQHLSDNNTSNCGPSDSVGDSSPSLSMYDCKIRGSRPPLIQNHFSLIHNQNSSDKEFASLMSDNLSSPKDGSMMDHPNRLKINNLEFDPKHSPVFMHNSNPPTDSNSGSTMVPDFKFSPITSLSSQALVQILSSPKPSRSISQQTYMSPPELREPRSMNYSTTIHKSVSAGHANRGLPNPELCTPRTMIKHTLAPPLFRPEDTLISDYYNSSSSSTRNYQLHPVRSPLVSRVCPIPVVQYPHESDDNSEDSFCSSSKNSNKCVKRPNKIETKAYGGDQLDMCPPMTKIERKNTISPKLNHPKISKSELQRAQTKNDSLDPDKSKLEHQSFLDSSKLATSLIDSPTHQSKSMMDSITALDLKSSNGLLKPEKQLRFCISTAKDYHPNLQQPAKVDLAIHMCRSFQQ